MQDSIHIKHKNLGRITRKLISIGLYVLLLSGSTVNANWNRNHVSYTVSNEDEGPRLTGHVQNWATLVQNYILQVSFKIFSFVCKKELQVSVCLKQIGYFFSLIERAGQSLQFINLQNV